MKRINWVLDCHKLDNEVFHFLSGRMGGIEVCWINIDTYDSTTGDLYYPGEDGYDMEGIPVGELKNHAEVHLARVLLSVPGLEVTG